jgi:hypothetical protein
MGLVGRVHVRCVLMFVGFYCFSIVMFRFVPLLEVKINIRVIRRK